MPEKNNGAQEGRPAAPEDESCDTGSMLWNAKSLQRVVENLERTRPESPQSDLLLFNGRAWARAILLSLATEIALKERCCMDRGGDGIRPFPSRSVRRCVRTQAVRGRSLCSELSDRPESP